MSIKTMDAIRTEELVRLYRPARSKYEPWTWMDEERDIFTRECLCCGRIGHYQRELEAHIAVFGMGGLNIYLCDGVVQDGNHRVVAAIRLGIGWLPLEKEADAQARWIRQHGYVSWNDRKCGDRAAAQGGQIID